MRPLLLLLAVTTAAAATPPTRADAPDAAVPPPSAPTDAPPCSLAARLAARSDTSAFLELLQKRGLAHDLARTDLALTLFAPTNAALEAFDVLPPTAPGGGSVGALVSSAPAALPVITGGQFVRGVVPVAQLTRGRSLTTLLTDKAVGQGDRRISIHVDSADASSIVLISDAGARARVVDADDGHCGSGAPALHVVDGVLVPFKL